MRFQFSGRIALLSALGVALFTGCVAPRMPAAPAAQPVPPAFAAVQTTDGTASDSSSAQVPWRTFFRDSSLRALIDTAIRNNPEMLATLQEIEMARSGVQFARGRLAPQVAAGASLGIDKAARYTAEGAGNASTEITEGKEVPEPIGDIRLGFTAAWEADVRGNLRAQKGAALARYLGSVEGSRYVMTSLVAEVANSYYELVALDAKLAIVRQAIALQRNELEVVRAQREAAAVTELAVKQFEALLLNAQSLEFELQQQVQETENRLNLLLGRFPQHITRSGAAGDLADVPTLLSGLPSHLLLNRPDILQAEWQLKAAHFDLRAARAEFFPELSLTGGLGLRAFKPKYLFTLPEGLAFSLAGDVMAPLVNRSALKAEFRRASAEQQKALLGYRQSILGGVNEVSTLVSAVDNIRRVYDFKSQQAAALDRSVAIAGDLFNAARANYLEVLTAQREAIDVKLELVEAQLRQRIVITNLYRALGGGWR